MEKDERHLRLSQVSNHKGGRQPIPKDFLLGSAPSLKLPVLIQYVIYFRTFIGFTSSKNLHSRGDL